MKKSIVAVTLMLSLTGCASTPGGMNIQFGIDTTLQNNLPQNLS